MGSFTFNGVSSESKGVYVSTFPSYTYPEKNIETYQIPGRNGTTIYDDGTYKNTTVTYDVSVYKPSLSITAAFENFVEWLHPSKLGYCKLTDTYYPGRYRLAICKNSGEVANLLNTVGTAKVVFECRPERFANGYATAYGNTTTGGTGFKNNDPTIARPEFELTGPCTIEIDTSNPVSSSSSHYSKIIVSSGWSGTMYIDENLDARIGDTYYNDKLNVAFGYPRLYPGQNYVKVTGSGNVKVYTRWWTI